MCHFYKRRPLCFDQMNEASITAGVSTASMGKFDRHVRGEKVGERTHVSKKRKLVATGSEHTSMSKMADKMVREKSDEALDIGRAVSKLEAEKRKQRHTEKVKGAIEVGFGGKKGKKSFLNKSRTKVKSTKGRDPQKKGISKPGKFAAKQRGKK